MQTQFISHAQVVPPTLVPRRGLGLFGALTIVVAILAGVATGALMLLQKSMQEKVNVAKVHLAQLHKEMEIPSIQEAQSLQQRIERGYSILNQHVYSSQAFNFIENHILDKVALRSFGYSGSKIRVDLRVSDYLSYAQQIRYFRRLASEHKDMTDFIPSAPTVTSSGAVDFSADITLSDTYIHSKPVSENTSSLTPDNIVAPPLDNSIINL
ncbi:MAG: hypothetical protein AAB482_02685 [Patescibacteria group bacterium]